MKTWKAIFALMLLGLLTGCNRSPEVSKKRYLESGKQYANKGKYAEARIQYRKALQLDPGLGDAYYELGLADSALQNWEDALAAFQQAYELEPQRLDVGLQLGHLYTAASQFGPAKEIVNSLLQKNPNNADAELLEGDIFVRQQNPEEALRAFTKVADLAPKDPASFERIALVEASMRRYADADQNLRKAIQIDPSLVEAYLNLSVLYRFQKQPEKAVEVLQQALDRNPDAVALYIAEADLLYSQDKKDAAESALQLLRSHVKTSAEASLAVGDFYAQHGSMDRALAEFKSGLAIDPNNIDLENHSVEAYLASKRLAEASALNQSVLKQKPKDTLAHIQSARIMLAGGHTDEAVAALRRQVRDSSDLPQAHYFLALAYRQQGSLEAAKSELQETLRVAPQMISAIEELTKLQLAEGNVREAKDSAIRGVQLAPGDASIRILLGTAFLRSGDAKAAGEQFGLAQQLIPNDPTPHLRLASVYQVQKNWAAEGRELETAVSLSPQSPEPLSALADFLVSRNERPKAIARIEQSMAIHPTDANIHVILGSLLAGAESSDQAKAEFERAIELNPNLIAPYLRLAKLEQGRGNVDVAIARYEKALSLQPKLVPLLTLIGNLYLEDKVNLDTARKYYERAVAIDPNFAPALGNLAYVQAKQGADLNVALSLAQKAKQLSPDTDAITDILGWVEYLRGSRGEILPMFKECVQKDPERAVYRYHLGMALLASGDKREAKSELEAALRLKLSSDDAQHARETLAHIQSN